jgi:hypothetical protein
MVTLDEFISSGFWDHDGAFLNSTREPKRPGTCGAGCDESNLFSLLLGSSSYGNADFVLLAAKRISQPEFVFEHFPESLPGDCNFFAKDVVLELVRNLSSRALSRLSRTPARADGDVVLAFVQNNGRCLPDVDGSLKQASDVSKVACQILSLVGKRQLQNISMCQLITTTKSRCL